MFEVERNGEEGSKRPAYSFYPVGQPDGTTIEDILEDCGFEEMPDAVGTKILDKSADDMEYYIRNGAFPADREAPSSRGASEEVPVRRRTRGGDRF